MVFIPLLSIICALSATNASPVSALPVRPYLFLAPELPKFQLQPTQFKVLPTVPGQPATKTELPAGKQYVLVYPSYQYLTTRQDGSSGSGFFETIQNYFINFGNNGQSDEASAVMDPIEPDKPAQAAAATETSPAIAAASDAAPEKPSDSAQKQKFFYSYITPASTVPLSADRRFYFLSEQPQIYGTFNGPSVNPVFNLQPLPIVQPVPIVQSRSSVAQVPDEPQPGKVVSENVQKFSQIPPVMTAVEQPVIQVKSISEHSDAVPVDALQDRVAPVVVDNRALPVPTETVAENVPSVPVVASSVPAVVATVPDVVASLPAVVEARNKPIPAEVVPETVSQVVADEKSELIGSAQSTVDFALKTLPSVVTPVVAPVVVDQSVKSSEIVESVTQSV